jgi:hypothetical protein
MAGEAGEQTTRFYTVDEANKTLPSVQPLLERIREAVLKLTEEKTLAAVREKASHNGGGALVQELSKRARVMEEDVQKLQSMGIILRDPSIGLIDFLHRRGSEVVCLCWKLGEGKSLQWWHPMDTGIAGRQRL